MLIFREMKPEDVEQVSRMEEEAFSMPWSPQAFLEMIESENAYYIVAEKDGVIVGACGVLQVLDEGDITNVVVDAARRGQGIATAMLSFLMQEGEKRGICSFTLEVRVSNEAAIHIYEKLGFVCEGKRKNFYEKPREDACIMWKR